MFSRSIHLLKLRTCLALGQASFVLPYGFSFMLVKKAMDEKNDFLAGEVTKFREYTVKLFRLVYRDDEEFLTELSRIFDDLNSLEYSLKFVREEVKFSGISLWAIKEHYM